MIPEAVGFMKRYEREERELGSEYLINLITREYPKIVIVEASWSDNGLTYHGITILSAEENEDLIKRDIDAGEWLMKHEDLLSHLRFNHYIESMRNQNKAIGSKSGLLTFSLFHFNLSRIFDSDNKFVPEKKIQNTKLAEKAVEYIEKELEDTKDGNNAKKIRILNDEEKGVRKVYNEFIKELLRRLELKEQDFKAQTEKADEANKFRRESGDIYVYLHIPGQENLVDELHKHRTSYRIFLDPEPVKKGNCPLCGSKDVSIGSPSIYHTLKLEKKPYSIHWERPQVESIRLCRECLLYFSKFNQFLRESDIDFFPLFVREKFNEEEIRFLIRQNGNGHDFFEILRHITQEIRREERLDFILLHLKREILYYDYVSNYELELGEFRRFLSKPTGLLGPEGRKDREWFRNLLASNEVLGVRGGRFFEELGKGINTWRKKLIYKYREKLFDFIYRNENCLTFSNINEIVITNIESKIRDGKISRSHAEELIDLCLNSEILIRDTNEFVARKDGEVMLDRIRAKKKEIVESGSDLRISSDGEFAYWLGQVIYYLMEQSKARDKMTLLTPLINCHSPESLKRTVVRDYLDKYVHNLSTYKNFRHKVLADVSDYLDSLHVPFDKLRIPFYTGFFDENIFFEKKKEG